MAVTAVAITGVASLLCGLALGYLITYCRMRKQLREPESLRSPSKTQQENYAYKSRSSINQDNKMSGDHSSTVDEGEGEDDDRARGGRLLKY